MNIKKEYKYLNEWIELYNSGKSITQIAKDYGVTMTTVKRRIKGHVEIRPRSPYLKYANEWLELYNSGMKKSDIATKYSVSKVTVGKILAKVGVEINGQKKHLNLIDDMKEMYLSGMSLSEISDKLGLSIQSICNYLEYAKVKRRPYTEACRTFSIHEDFFKVIDAENKAFILGILWCLGNIVYDEGIPRNVRISTSRKELLELIVKTLYNDKSAIGNRINNGSYVKDIFCEGITSDLIKLGFSNKNNKKIPAFNNVYIKNAFMDGILYVKLTLYKDNKYKAYIKSSEQDLSQAIYDYIINRIGIELKAAKIVTMSNSETGDAFDIYGQNEVAKLKTHANSIENKYIKKLDI